MTLPIYTKSGQKWRREWIRIQLDEIQKETIHQPESETNWLPMMIELYDWCCLLEDRIITLEEEMSQ